MWKDQGITLGFLEKQSKPHGAALESKVISLNSPDQQGRQDKQYLILCTASVKVLLEQAGEIWPNAIASARRIIQNANHQLGIETLQNHNIELLDAIPWSEWKASDIPELRNFGELEVHHRQQPFEKIREAKDLSDWVKSLNNPTGN